MFACVQLTQLLHKFCAFFCPFLEFLDPETVVFLQFLDRETTPFLQFLGALWIVGGYLPTPSGGPMDRRASRKLT